ncbi:GxGYxYP domain-containing protein [Cohnella sp. WQ 127256]|uniref:GxGYxYP domain-containing protein n=1 Tax=Cohnella sp. WQ 127256 TaxID=2938790 RepID=UPI002118056A|nr:GxGYxYP domain-containing protein [Cohnella sp. WQ 127256]
MKIKWNLFLSLILAVTLTAPIVAPSSIAHASIGANVYDTTNLGYNQSIIARSLQGIVNKTSTSANRLFIDTNLWNYQQTATKWMDYYTNTKGYSFNRLNSLDDVLKKYQSNIPGLAIYDFRTDAARWIAETYSGIHNALPVSADMVDTALQDNFTTFGGWSVGGDPGGSASSNGDLLNISSAASGKYALIYRTVTVDVDSYPYLQLKVNGLTGSGANWFIAVNQNGVTTRIPASSTEVGVSTIDLRQKTGFSGNVTFQLQIGVQGGAGKSVSLDWMHIGKYGFADNFYTLNGWTVGSPNGGHSLTTNGENATLSTGPSSGYALMRRSLTFNADEYSYIDVKATAATGNWHVVLRDVAQNIDYPLYPSSLTGEFLFQIGANTQGRRGGQTFELQIVANGGVNSSVTLDWVRVGRHPFEEGNFINSFAVSKDLRTHNWTNDTTAYNWAIANLLPLTDKKSAYHVGDEEYASNTGQYQASSLDIAVQSGAFSFRLPPTMSEVDKMTLFNNILNHLSAPAAIYGGWQGAFENDPSGAPSGEEKFITAIAQNGHYAVLSPGSNGSFHSTVPAGPVSFNQSRTIGTSPIDSDKYYVAFMTAEGDTFASATDFVTGQWMDPGRGTVPINWQWNPMFQTRFPAMAEYYRNSATANDYFYSAIPVGYTFLTEMSGANLTKFTNFSKTALDQANIAVADKWDTHWNLGVAESFTTGTNLSAIFEGTMPGAVDSVDGNSFAQVRTLGNGAPFVTPVFHLQYPTKNADGSPLTVQGLTDMIRTEANKHKKPFFLKVFLNTYKFGNSTFDEHLPTAIKQVADNLGTTDYKVVKLDEFVGAFKSGINFQDDFVYKSRLWGVGPSGASLTVANGKATLSSGANTFGLMYQPVKVDVAKHKYISISVPRIDSGANWTVNIFDGTTTWRLPNGGSTSTGTFNFDIQAATGWTTGVKSFDIQVAVNGSGKSVDVDWLRIGSIQN